MIHKFQNNGYYLVLDVHSGAVHVVDALIDAMLDHTDLFLKMNGGMKRQCPPALSTAVSALGTSDEVEEAYAELLTVHANGQLFSRDEYAPYAAQMTISPLKAMCLHVTHDCNLSCRYCFAGQGQYGGQSELMSFEVARAAIDFLVRHSYGRRHLELDFFGGEPLMNFNVVRRTVSYARALEARYDKEFRFTMTTNGVLLNRESMSYLNGEMHNVVLSLDGRPEINDFMRPRRGGQGSYQTIVSKYQDFVAMRGDKDYYVRGTFTRRNLDFAEDVFHLYELGFDQVSVEPVVGDAAAFPYAVTEEDVPAICAEYDRLAKRILAQRQTPSARRLNFFHFMLDLDGGPCAIKRIKGCGCGNEYTAVAPNGDIYPCHQFVGQSQWRMGSVLEGDYDVHMKDRFSRTTIYQKPACLDCWAKFHCSGGCNANNWQYAGDLLKPHTLSCALEKKRLECALMLKAASLSVD